MPRRIPSYFDVDFLKFVYNNYCFAETVYFVVFKHPN
jgi:hypothetical protein